MKALSPAAAIGDACMQAGKGRRSVPSAGGTTAAAGTRLCMRSLRERFSEQKSHTTVITIQRVSSALPWQGSTNIQKTPAVINEPHLR